jgi:hypothetical protein
MDDPPPHRWFRSSPLLLSITLLLVFVSGGCSQQEVPDAYGNFEAIEVIVASKVAGELLQFTPVEGVVLAASQEVGSSPRGLGRARKRAPRTRRCRPWKCET